MKKTKFLASLMAIIMLMATLSTTFVSAAPVTDDVTAVSTSANLIVENEFTNSGIFISGKTYNLYQIFTAETIHTDEEDLESIEYFTNPDFYKFFFDKAGIIYPADPTVETYEEDVIAYNHAATDFIHSYETDNASKQALVSLIREYIIAEEIQPIATTGSTSKVGNVEYQTAEGVELGYYAIFDSVAITGVNTAGETVTNGSLATIPCRGEEGKFNSDVTIALKGTAPKIEKEIWHNDKANIQGDNSPLLGTEGTWDKVSDYQIGDVVGFRLKVKIPTDVSVYDEKTYEFIITDTLSSGLQFNDDIKVSEFADLSNLVDGSLHTQVNGAPSDDFTFKLVFSKSDLEAIYAGFNGTDVFYIYYTATVTKDAVIYDENGEIKYENNEVVLDFSNNPYDNESKGQSKDEVFGYTFDMDVTKTKGDGVTALAGAVFALYEVKNGDVSTTKQIYLEEDTAKTNATGVPTYFVSNGKASDKVDSHAGTITTRDGEFGGKFNIIGLDDAKHYELVEILAPEGYNKADPIRITIQATYPDGSIEPTVGVTSTSTVKDTEFTVINTSAKLLPETGGMGTTLFTIAGIVIMLGAVVFLFVRRKKAE